MTPKIGGVIKLADAETYFVPIYSPDEDVIVQYVFACNAGTRIGL